jgi:hypothetical protein
VGVGKTGVQGPGRRQTVGTQAKSPYDEQDEAIKGLPENQAFERAAPYIRFLSIYYGTAREGAKSK